METLYQNTKSTLDGVERLFRQLEHCSPTESYYIENEIKSRLDEVSNSFRDLDIMVNKEVQPRRTSSRVRVDQLKYDCNHYGASLRTFSERRLSREREMREREELMSKTFTTNDNDTSITIDQSLHHNRSLNNAHLGMDELLSSGTNVLENLREQKLTLKGAQRKIMDVANTLGLSNTVMRLIEKRTYYDKFILVFGMIVTVLVMLLIVVYFTNIF